MSPDNKIAYDNLISNFSNRYQTYKLILNNIQRNYEQEFNLPTSRHSISLLSNHLDQFGINHIKSRVNEVLSSLDTYMIRINSLETSLINYSKQFEDLAIDISGEQDGENNRSLSTLDTRKDDISRIYRALQLQKNTTMELKDALEEIIKPAHLKDFLLSFCEGKINVDDPQHAEVLYQAASLENNNDPNRYDAIRNLFEQYAKPYITRNNLTYS